MTGGGAPGERALGSRYTLVDRIGQGASGEVWRARDRLTGTDRAAKLLWPRHAADPEILARFVQERSVLTGLDHPLLVRVHDFVVEGADLAIVMDLVTGPDLGTVLREAGTLSASSAVPIAAAVLEALASAHGHGVVHRDVKPDNVLLARSGPPRAQDVRLADFGIAGMVHDGVASATELIGTPAYMAPELVSYGRAGPPTDVYAAGVLLHELLAGRTPFAGPGTPVTLALRHVHDQPPRLPVHDTLRQVLDRLLAKDPAARPTAAESVRLLRGLPDAALTAAPLPVQAAPRSWTRSRTSLPGRQAVEVALALPRTGPGPEPSTGGHPPGPEQVEDPGQATSLRPGRPVAPVDPEPDRVGPDRVDGPDATMMRASAPDPATVRRPPAPTPMRTRARVLIGCGAALLVGAAGVLVWRSGLLDGGDAPPVEITTVAAHRNGNPLPTGLRVDLDAAYDATEGLSRVRATVSAAPNAPLRGDVLLVLPGLGSGCAEVAEQEGVVRTVRASTDGLDLACAHRLVDVDLPGGATVTVDLAVDLDLLDDDGVPADDYGAWLESVQAATDAGLARVPGTDFALQRVSAISVEPADVTLAGSAIEVPYRVAATWSGGGPDGVTELFTGSTSDGMEVDLLRQLTGDAGLDGVVVSACHAARVIGIRVLAEQPESACAMQVRVGALDSGEARFGVRMR